MNEKLKRLSELEEQLKGENLSVTDIQNISEEVSRINSEIGKEKTMNDIKNGKDGFKINENIENIEKASYEEVFIKFMSNEKLTADEEKIIEQKAQATNEMVSKTNIIQNQLMKSSTTRIVAPINITASILNDKRQLSKMHTTATLPLGKETTSYEMMAIPKEQYAFFDDVNKSYISGLLKLPYYKGVLTNEASVLLENECMESSTNDIGMRMLEYFPIGMYTEYSEQLKAVSGYDFVSLFTEEQQENVRGKLARLTTRGVGGALGTSERVTPYGILVDLETNYKDTNVIEVDGTTITADGLKQAKKLLKKGWGMASWYANKETISDIEDLENATGDALFKENFRNNGNATPYGRMLKEDNSIPDGYVLLADAYHTYRWNFSGGLIVETDKDIKCQKNEMSTYVIGDGGMVDSNYAVLVKLKNVAITAEPKKRK